MGVGAGRPYMLHVRCRRKNVHVHHLISWWHWLYTARAYAL